MALIPVDEKTVRDELHKLCLVGVGDSVVDLLDRVPNSQLAGSCMMLDTDGSTALHVAARGGHLRITEELLRRGVEVNLLDRHGRTPLHVACEEGHADVALELIMGRVDVNVQDVPKTWAKNEKGELVEVADDPKCGETALHKAVLANNVEVVELLMDSGAADPTLAAGAGVTPALLAAERGHVGPLQALLSRRPELCDVRNESGWTPLHLAAHGDVHQRKVTTAKPSKFPGVVKMLLEAKADLEATDEDTKTPLHRAAATGNADIAAALLQAGANAGATDICRWTPLHYACQDGHLRVAQLLIGAGAAVQSQNPPCLTPLAVATMENQVKMAELLVASRADPNLHGRGLASPLMIARKAVADGEKYSDLLALFELGFVHH